MVKYINCIIIAFVHVETLKSLTSDLCTELSLSLSQGNCVQSIKGHGHVWLLSSIWCHCGKSFYF